MADYGLVIRNAAGDITLNTTDTITRLRYRTGASAGADGNAVLSDISGKNTVEFVLAGESQSISKARHGVSRSGTTISWTHRHVTAVGGPVEGSTIDSLIVVFLYD